MSWAEQMVCTTRPHSIRQGSTAMRAHTLLNDSANPAKLATAPQPQLRTTCSSLPLSLPACGTSTVAHARVAAMQHGSEGPSLS